MNRELWSRFMIPVGVLMVLAGEVLYWHDSILSPGYRALGLPLWTAVVFPAPSFRLLSYGVVTLLLLVLALVAGRVRRPIIVVWCAFFLVLLGLQCPLQIGFSQPSWLDLYSQNNLEYTSISGFANRHSYPDVGPALASSTMQALDGLYDRLQGTILSLKIGWTFHTLGSLLFLVGATMAIGRWSVLRPHVKLATAIFLGFLALNLTGPFAGEACWNRGIKEERAGNLDAASNYYHWAMKLDVWNRYNVRAYQRLGVIAEAQNRLNAPEYHLLSGLRNTEFHNMDAAMADFQQVMKASDPYLARQGRVQNAALLSGIALTFYQSGSPGTAAFFWQKSASTSESHLAEDYMAARGQQDSGQFNAALSSLGQAQTETSGPLLLSEVYASLGDVYYYRKDVVQARLEYLESISMVENHVEYKDMRAQKALTDNLQQ